jgi:hypothetical protein
MGFTGLIYGHYRYGVGRDVKAISFQDKTLRLYYGGGESQQFKLQRVRGILDNLCGDLWKGFGKLEVYARPRAFHARDIRKYRGAFYQPHSDD